MTDWSRLHHAYGTAEDIPGRLELLATAPDRDQWNDLWSALCHQSTTYPASYAALPHLAELAEKPGDPTDAVLLAGAIVSGGGDRVRAEHTEAVTRLHAVTQRLLPDADDGTYAYLIECVLAFDGVAYWAHTSEFAWGVVNDEYEIECFRCQTPAYIKIAEGVSEDEVNGRTHPLRPAHPDSLTGLARRMHDTAAGHGKAEVVRAVLHYFATATCLGCARELVVADELR